MFLFSVHTVIEAYNSHAQSILSAVHAAMTHSTVAIVPAYYALAFIQRMI